MWSLSLASFVEPSLKTAACYLYLAVRGSTSAGLSATAFDVGAGAFVVYFDSVFRGVPKAFDIPEGA